MRKTKNFSKTVLLFSCLVLCCLSVYKNNKATALKNILFYTFEYVLFYMSAIREKAKDKYATTCCIVREHCCAVSTYIYFQLLDI